MDKSLTSRIGKHFIDPRTGELTQEGRFAEAELMAADENGRCRRGLSDFARGPGRVPSL